MRYVLVIFILSSISSFAQDTVTFNDGEFYLKGEQITANEFNVLLENQGLMTPYNKRLMDASQDRIWNEQQIRRTYQSWQELGIVAVFYGWITLRNWHMGPLLPAPLLLECHTLTLKNAPIATIPKWLMNIISPF